MNNAARMEAWKYRQERKQAARPSLPLLTAQQIIDQIELWTRTMNPKVIIPRC